MPRMVETDAMPTTTLERVQEVLMRVLHVPSTVFTHPARLDELAAVDSLSLAEIAAALDEEFGIEVDGDRLTTGLSVPQIAALVEEAMAAPAPGRVTPSS